MKDNILYSPWRINYILEKKKDNQCIFCIHPSEDAKHLVIYRSSQSFVILNLYPYNNGHIMVVPNKHVATLNELDSIELCDLFKLVQLSEKIIKNVYTPDGLNIGINLGKAAGAGIDNHLHVHLVPRWNGDNNFMSSIAGTRVIPESFDNSYQKLKEVFDIETHI